MLQIHAGGPRPRGDRRPRRLRARAVRGGARAPAHPPLDRRRHRPDGPRRRPRRRGLRPVGPGAADRRADPAGGAADPGAREQRRTARRQRDRTGPEGGDRAPEDGGGGVHVGQGQNGQGRDEGAGRAAGVRREQLSLRRRREPADRGRPGGGHLLPRLLLPRHRESLQEEDRQDRRAAPLAEEAHRRDPRRDQLADRQLHPRAAAHERRRRRRHDARRCGTSGFSSSSSGGCWPASSIPSRTSDRSS